MYAWKEKQKKKELDLIKSVDARMISRFMKGDKLPTLHIIASSKSSEQSFLETYIETKKKNNRMLMLYIAGILAAILVPALLGYIDRAKDNQDILNARTLYTSAQTVASEYYGKDKIINFPQDGDFNNDVLKLSDLSSDDFQYAYIGFGKNDTDSHSKYTVEMVVYYNKKGVMFFMKDGNAWQRCESGEEDSVIQDLDSNYKHALVMDLSHQ